MQNIEDVELYQIVYMRIIDDRNNISITKGMLMNFEEIYEGSNIANFDIKEGYNEFHFENVSFDEKFVIGHYGVLKFEFYFSLFEYVKQAELRIIEMIESKDPDEDIKNKLLKIWNTKQD